MEHKRMVNILCEDTAILKQALNLSDLWIRTSEYVIDNETNEKADLIFQNYYDSFNRHPENTICYIVELKSDIADHEVLGQLKKAIDILDEKGKRHGHWFTTKGLAISKDYTKSGLKLIKQQGYLAFKWNEFKNKVVLNKL